MCKKNWEEQCHNPTKWPLARQNWLYQSVIGACVHSPAGMSQISVNAVQDILLPAWLFWIGRELSDGLGIEQTATC